MANECVYIHELIDITGHQRNRYLHHMTANWVPVALAERNQRCFGVWATVGSTGAWPQVVNMWELDGWDGLVANFEHEFAAGRTQDPSLADWWAAAAGMRRGGFDRVLVPAPWSPTISELTKHPAQCAVYAHELITVRPGWSGDLLDALHTMGRRVVTEAVGEDSIALIGAFRVAMRADDECVVIWGFRDWASWAAYEQAQTGQPLEGWRRALDGFDAQWQRSLLVDAPLAPLRIGRQPTAADRRPLDEIT